MAISFKRLKTEYDFHDTMPFGDYRGKTISWVIEFDPEYLQWCSKKENLLYLSSKCIEALEDRVSIAKYNKIFQAAKKQSKFLKEAEPSWHDDWLDDVPF